MRKVVIMICSATLIFLCASCGSKPAPEEPEKTAPVVEAPKPEPVKEEPPKVDNGAALKSMDGARKLAIDAGVEESAPEKLKAIDDLYEKAKAKSEKGEDISADSKDIADRYAALIAYVNACDANDEIDDSEMMYLAEDLYNKGYDDLVAYEDLFEDPNSTGKAQLEKATAASTAFNGVLAVIYKQLTRDSRKDALAAKKRADSVKAGVAQKAKYNQGIELFKKGDAAFSRMNYLDAYDIYVDVEEIFDELYDDIAEKRAAAQKLIEEARAKVKESENFALQADKKAPIKTKIEGIEDEDAVLLEADNYDDPASAEANLPENLEEPSLRTIIGDDAK